MKNNKEEVLLRVLGMIDGDVKINASNLKGITAIEFASAARLSEMLDLELLYKITRNDADVIDVNLNNMSGSNIGPSFYDLLKCVEGSIVDGEYCIGMRASK